MHLNTTPAAPAKMPCIRDYSELVNQRLPPSAVVKLTPLVELERRLHEIVAEHPHLREEAPLVLLGEAARRRRFAGLRPAAAPTQHQVA